MLKGLPADFYLVKIVESYLNIIIVRKGQGARSENRRKPWLKQLRVAVSTEASLPVGSSPQNSKTNFVDLRNSSRSLQKTNEDFS
jgi:hypothetical protein